jgi:glycosyltransferase involved in cell wall biosynthesis
LLYKVADAAGLAEKILYLCHNPDRARLLGEQGREWAVSIFNKRRYASELIETVNKVTEPARQLAQ